MTNGKVVWASRHLTDACLHSSSAELEVPSQWPHCAHVLLSCVAAAGGQAQTLQPVDSSCTDTVTKVCIPKVQQQDQAMN